MVAYLSDIDIETFSAQEYLDKRIPGYASMPEAKRKQARIEMTRDDVLLFAIIYFLDSLSAGGDGSITLADMHVELCKMARRFRGDLDPVNPLRLAIVAPRRAGKTTWLYKIISFWLACHQHRSFFYVVTGTAGQAQNWIKNFKLVIDRNKLIREDFPGLVTPMKREETGRSFADGANLYIAQSGFIIAAHSADSNNLGMIFDDDRPDFLLFDDIEPPGGSYSLHQMSQRLSNVSEGAIPMGQEGAIVVFVGTVLMPGAIMDQFREYAAKPDPKSWISDMGIRVRHFKPFVDKLTGEETTFAGSDSRSFWPGRHKTEKLIREQNTRNFAIVYANEPLPEEGAYWRDGDIKYGTIPPTAPTITAIVMDPALTTKKKSDFTAIAVVRFAPTLGLFEVLYGRSFKMNPGSEVSQKITEIAAWFPEATLLIVETNAGGDYNDEHFGAIPGLHYDPIKNTKADGNKAQRAAPVLRMYQTGQVVHTDETLSELERELYSFPNGLHDDLPDAVCFGILRLWDKYGRVQYSDTEEMYV